MARKGHYADLERVPRKFDSMHIGAEKFHWYEPIIVWEENVDNLVDEFEIFFLSKKHMPIYRIIPIGTI